jgi:hypothetical protein
MGFPTKVDAGWTEFRIDYKSSVECDGDACFGWVDFDRRIIEVDQTVILPSIRETLLHECLHVIFAGVGLGEEKLETNNEHLTEQTTKGLMMLTRLNPMLVRWLLFGGSWDFE